MARSTPSTDASAKARHAGQPHDDTPSAGARRLAYVPAEDLDRWKCRPLGTIGVLDLHDRRVGHLAGIVIDLRENRPIYLVIARQRAASERQHWFLVPVGDAWFDDTERAIRIDAPKGDRLPFDPDEFEKKSPEEADEFERRVLGTCCPEVGFHRDGTPDYERLEQFKCPVWLRPAG